MKPQGKGMNMSEDDSSFNLSSLKEAIDSAKKSSNPLDLSSLSHALSSVKRKKRFRRQRRESAVTKQVIEAEDPATMEALMKLLFPSDSEEYIKDLNQYLPTQSYKEPQQLCVLNQQIDILSFFD